MNSSFDLTYLHLAYQLDPVRRRPGLHAAQATFRAARGRSGDTLVLHLALDGTAPLTTREHASLVKTLGDIYFRTSGSATSAMRTVAERLNNLLVERNQRGANRSLQSAGLLTQAVFRGDRLYLAQCGPTHAFLIKSSDLTHYHLSNLVWRGLGFNRVPEIRYHQMKVGPGDLLLIAADLPPAWTAEQLIQLPDLSLDEMASALVDQAAIDLDAGLICLGPGTGKLHVVDPESIDALNPDPETLERITARSQALFPEETFPQEGSASDEEPAPGDDLREEIPTKDETLVPQSPESLPPESDSPQVAPTEVSAVGSIDGDPMEEPQTAAPERGERRDTQEFQAELTAAPQVSGSRRERLPFWAWSLVVVVLLAGIVGLVLLIGQGVSDFQLGALGFVPATDTLTPTVTWTSVPSVTPRPTNTNTVPPPTLTLTPLPPSVTPTFSPTPKYRVGSTQISPLDDMILVYVPAGTFMMGASEDDPNALRDERPQHRVNLDAFWIDKTEVSNSQYAKCVAARDCRVPYSLTSFTQNPYYGDPEFVDYPVIFISWNDAQNYCEWAGRRLPTEAEWEKAARGPEEQLYPWGEELDCELANYRDCLGDTAAVTSYPAGASPYGALNMAGNVWEWVVDWYSFAYYDIAPLDYPTGPESGAYRVIRGGSWNDDPIYLRTSSRYWYYPDNARFSVGFRCAITELP